MHTAHRVPVWRAMLKFLGIPAFLQLLGRAEFSGNLTTEMCISEQCVILLFLTETEFFSGKYEYCTQSPSIESRVRVSAGL